MDEQQQQQENLKPMLTIKTKGKVYSDMKKFLANKKKERAVLVTMGENKVNSAGSHAQPGFEVLLHAQRQRLGGISALKDQLGQNCGAAKGQ